MSCILRIIVNDIAFDEMLSIPLEPDSFWRKGESSPSKNSTDKKFKDSGGNYVVSDAEFEEFAQQKQDAFEYLMHNKTQIRQIMSLSGAQGTLDFGIIWRDVAVQCDHFPAELIRIAGELGLAIELTQYPPSEDEDDEDEENNEVVQE